MKKSFVLTVLMGVAGLCVSAQGEVLVYSITPNIKIFEQGVGGSWTAGTETGHSYIVVDIDYADFSIRDCWSIDYWQDGTQKRFTAGTATDNFYWDRAPRGKVVDWILVYLDQSGDEAGLAILSGSARATGIGTATRKEVATTLSGYYLGIGLNISEDETEPPDFSSYSKGPVSCKLYSTWTTWANAPTKGNQDLQATVDMIKEALKKKGYQEEIGG